MLKQFLALALTVGLAVCSVRADAPGILGKPAPPFTLKDTKGQTVSLDQLQDAKAVVVIFVGTECPINNAYMPRLAQLHKEYAPKGVRFVAINANRQDTPDRIAAHAKKNDLPFPVLKDAGNRVADSFAAKRTPEAFVLDGQRVIRYQGRIDDQFGVGYSRPNPTSRDLVDALDAVLAGKPVARPTTSVAGCLIGRVSTTKADGAITFTKHIAPILQKNCQECHRPGQIGPMSLLSYDDAVSWADTVREVLDDQRMPPWYADPRYGKFSNDRRLSADDRAMLMKWLDSGTPKGDDKDLPPPAQFAEGWRIGKPDVVLSMAEEFAVPAETPKLGIPYKHFYVQTNFKEDRWVARAECRPGAAAVVHHIIVYVVPPEVSFHPESPRSPVLAGTAPGDMPLILPDGMAKKIHYTPNGIAQKDRSSVGLIFAKEPPKRPALTIPINNPRFRIPPGDDNYKVESEFTFRESGGILGFMPHMHLRGKDFLYELVYPDGKKETLLSVPRYNFNWQSVYRFDQPVRVPKGTKVHCVAHFDNSEKNLNNPDPKKTVTWGDQTWQEMMIGWIDFTYDKDPPPMPRGRKKAQ
jgi:peroxiredoxin